MMYGIIMVLMQPMADLSGLIPPIMMRTRRGDEWADAAVDNGMGRADDNNDKTRQRGRGDETIQPKEDAGEALKDGRIAEGRQGRR